MGQQGQTQSEINIAGTGSLTGVLHSETEDLLGLVKLREFDASRTKK
jgi:hypothetical protein